MTDFQSLVETRLEPVGTSNSDIIYRCPLCEGDSGSGHLYVNYTKGFFNCFKCEFSGRSINKLLRVLKIDSGYHYEKLYDRDERLDDILNISKPKSTQTVYQYSTDIISLTQYYDEHSKPLSREALIYLAKRHISQSTINALGIREGISRYGETFEIRGKQYNGRDYSGRILIPSRQRNGLVSFYVARDYVGDKSPKYLNPPKELAVASEDVWNLDMIDSSYVVICEGVMTSISINEALGKSISCATYGKSIAQSSSNIEVRVTSQGEKLLDKKFSQYIIFYDKDASKESYDTAKYLYDRGASVRVVKIDTDKYGPKADANDMTREEIISHITSSKIFDEFMGIL